MVEEIPPLELVDTTHLVFWCPSKVQVGAVVFEEITDEMSGNTGKALQHGINRQP